MIYACFFSSSRFEVDSLYFNASSTRDVGTCSLLFLSSISATSNLSHINFILFDPEVYYRSIYISIFNSVTLIFCILCYLTSQHCDTQSIGGLIAILWKRHFTLIGICLLHSIEVYAILTNIL